MNFRDLYKSANDNIEGNRDLINLIYEKAEKKPIMIFRYAALCAACLILVISLSVFPAFRNTKTTPDVQIAKNTPDKTTQTPKTVVEDNQNTKYITENIKTDNSAQEQINNKEVIINSTVDEKEDTLQGDTVEERFDFELDEQVPVVLQSAEHQVNVSATSGGAAPKMARVTTENSFSEIQQMSRQSYFEYLGIENLNFESSLPVGMSFSMPEIVSIVVDSKSGNTVDDAIQIVAPDANDENRILTLTTTCVPDLYFTHNALSEINGVVVKKNIGDTGHSAYFQYSSACITVNSYGLSEQDLDMFIENFLK